MKNKVIGLLVALLMVLACLQSLSFEAQADAVKVKVVRVYWGTSTAPVQAEPGDLEVPLNIEMENLDTVTINYVEAKLNLAGTPFRNTVHGSEAYAGASSITPGGTFTLTFRLNIDEDAELKTYQVPLTLTLFTSKYASGVDVEVNVPVPLYGEVKISASLEPDTVLPGRRTVNLKLENLGGGDASSLEVTVSPVSPMALAEGDGYYRVGGLKAGSTVEVPLKLYVPESLEGGSNLINVSLSYVDAYGNSHSETRTLSLTVSSLGEFFSVEVSPQTVRPEASPVTFTLTNVGGEAVEDLEVSLTLPATLSLLGEDSCWRFEQVASGESVSFTVQLYASTAAVGSAAQATLTLTYNAGGLVRGEVKTVGFKVGEQTVPSVKVEVVDAGWGSMDKPVRAGPGDEAAPLYIAVQNKGSRTMVGVKGELQLEAPFSGTHGEATVSAFVPSIQPGQVGQLVFPVDIAPDAEVKTYSLKVKLNYLILNEVSSPPSYVEAEPVTLTVEVPLYGKPVLQLKADRHELRAGSLSTVTFTLANTGSGGIQDLSIRLQLPPSTMGKSPLALAGQDGFWYFSRLEAGSQQTFKVNLLVSEDAAGPYSLTFTLTYKDEWGTPYSETRSVGVQISPGSPLIVVESYKLEPEEVKVGEEFKVKLELANVSDSEVHRVMVQLVTPQGFSTLTPSMVNLGSLKPGEKRTVEYLVASSPALEEGVVYSLEVDVSYVDRAGVPGVSKTVLGIPLHGIVELVTYDVEVKPAIPGGTFNLIFTLLNRGTTTAMYTTISLVSEGPFKAAGQPIYVGDLDPNAPLPVSLQIQVRPDTSPGIYQVKVQVYYKDEYHRPHKEYLTFPVKVLESLPVTETVKAEKTPREAVAGFTPIISAVVVAAAVAGAVLYFKRRKAKALQPSQG